MRALADLIGESAPVVALRADLERVITVIGGARRRPPVLIQGATGTGKGLIAQLLHRAGPLASQPFIALNCAAIPENLLEAELFGYEAGAFTDARRRKPGLFEAAHGGVLFLDEVGLLSAALQAKLLTAIEERRIRRLGATTYETVDVWVIAATNTDLVSAVRAKTFREDLYHRLAVLELRLPPLRERGSDILLLARHFLARTCADYGLPPRRLLPAVEAKLLAYHWPGNVRELANAIERAALMTTGAAIEPAALELTHAADGPSTAPRRREQTMREELLAALEETDWNITHTAEKLAITRNTVRARIDRFGLARGSGNVPVAPVPIPEVSPAAGEPASVPYPSSARLLEWQRRRVVLLRVTVRPAGAAVAAAGALELAVDKILGFGGRVEAIRQQSMDASFGIEAVDEPARRAVNAALAIHRSLGQQPRSGSVAFSWALGVHTAQLLVARVSGGTKMDEGEKAAAASTLEALLEEAPAEAVLVTAELAPFLDRHFELARHARSGPDDRPIYLVVRHDVSGVGAWRKLSPFVGRDHELALMRQWWTAAIEGHGSVVNIVGSPGVGKSRLVWGLSRHCEENGRVLRIAQGPLDAASPYVAVGELMRALFGASSGEGADRADSRVRAVLQQLGIQPATVLGPVLELLGHPSAEWLRLDPGQRKRQISVAVRTLLNGLSARSPLAVIVEDGQWLDSESSAILGALVEPLASLRMMLMVVHRPEYAPPWAAQPHSHELRLAPLSEEDAAALLERLVGHDVSVEGLKPLIASSTGGNPLFLEETVRTLVESGSLVGEPGEYRLTRPVAKLDVPPTVEGVLTERIDRLAPGDKVVLQAMAVAGVEVELALLARLVDVDREELSRSLARLHRADFIYQTHTSPDRMFAFKHAITHEVAYATVNADRQRALHAAVLAIGEELYAGGHGEKAEWLAFHALKGGVWIRAVHHLRRAALRAIARAANRTAVQQLETALGALDRMPPGADRTRLAIDVRIELRHAVTPLGQVQRTLDHLRAAEALAVELGDAARLGWVVGFIANCLVLQGRYREALVTGQRASDIARERGDRSLELVSRMYTVRARLSRGEYDTAITMMQDILRSLDELPVDDFLGLPVLPAAWIGSTLASSLAEMGAFAEAQAHAREAVRRAELSGQPDSVMWANRGVGMVALLRGEATEAASIFGGVLSLCRTHDLDAYVARTMAGLGTAKARLGQVGEGLALLEQAVGLAEAAEPRTTYTGTLIALAEALNLAGQQDRALATARDALQRSRLHEERGAEAYAGWILATIQSADDGAADVFLAAAAVASELRLEPLLAHCWAGLAKLRERQCRLDEAADYRQRADQLFDVLDLRPWITAERMP